MNGVLVIGLVSLNRPIKNMDNTVGMLSNIDLMRNQNDRVAFLMEPFEHGHDFYSSFGVKVSCWFIGQNDRRIID